MTTTRPTADALPTVTGPLRFLYHGWAVRWHCECGQINQWVDGNPNSDPAIELPRRVTCKSCRAHYMLAEAPPKPKKREVAKPRHGGYMSLNDMP